MKRIRALHEPGRGLRDYLDLVGRDPEWDEFRSHNAGGSHKELLDGLIDLQHGLCGYCEIDLTELDRQVEHWIPRSDPVGASRSLDVTNMIACCKGGTEGVYGSTRTTDETRHRKPVRYHQSCGQKKGGQMNDDLIDPRTLPALPSLIRVLVNGRMEADVSACESVGVPVDRVRRTIEILGLNVGRLRDARERHWRALSDAWEDFAEDSGVMEEAARGELLPKNGRLHRFFSPKFLGASGVESSLTH